MKLFTFIKLLLLLAIGGGGYQYWQGHKAAGGGLGTMFDDDAAVGPIPIVFVNGRAKGNPGLEDVVAEYRRKPG